MTAGFIGGFPGARLGNLPIAIGGVALFGGGTAWLTDNITEAIKQYFYNN